MKGTFFGGPVKGTFCPNHFLWGLDLGLNRLDIDHSIPNLGSQNWN